MSAIERGIPAPEYRERMSWKVFDQMLPGDSITVPVAERVRAQNAVQSFQRRRPGAIFSTRTEGELVRVWRVK